MSVTANVAYCEKHGPHGEREECYVCGAKVDQIPLSDTAWLIWGRQKGSDEKWPLGAYISREVALDAQGLLEVHPNADRWEDFWITPWPLATKPTINFRMEM